MCRNLHSRNGGPVAAFRVVPGNHSLDNYQAFIRASCDPSRGCTVRGRAADWWSVSEATMRASKVVVVEPGRELLIAFFGVGVVADISPLAQSGLEAACGLAVGAGRVRRGRAVP